ncbi:M20 family metallopeptidase [Nitratireductor pacificus]|uniref:Probable succinyl-diaminopimelate desuccinylase n=1 Tax=Nitratireductor pacificus pht-3B TaxID=391937 RepID=K2N8K0_9HYPH|nr:M20 family metallopeptidase [Nitratireductor pacificus]EKF20433.1 acetylornithine deacetylase/succinyl-diaminopimelate desuccinylase [Nitratireductor pacificus pht-3B]
MLASAQTSRDALFFLQQAVGCKTVSPPGNEIVLARMIKARLADAGIDARIFQENEHQANLVATLKSGAPGPRLVLSGHLDTVPIGDAIWKHDPFSAVIDDGRIYGRGTVDMKGGLLALLFAFMQQKDVAPDRWCGELVFAATYGEEIGALGAATMVREGQIPEFDAMIIAEPTNNRLVIAHKGVIWLRVTSFGRTAHGSMPASGTNAVDKLHLFYDRLQSMDLGGTSTPLLSNPTFAVTTFNGGRNTNVIPDLCRMTVDIRTVPGQDHREVVAHVQAIAAALTAEDPEARFEVETTLDLPGLLTDEGAGIVRDCRKVLAARAPGADAVRGAQYFTDASAFIAHGGDIVILGPGAPELAHQTDEHLAVDDYFDAIEIYRQIIGRFLSRD